MEMARTLLALLLVGMISACAKTPEPHYIEEIIYGKTWDLLTPTGEIVGSYHFYHDGRIQCLTNYNAPIGQMYIENYSQHWRNAMWWTAVYPLGSVVMIYDVCNSQPKPRLVCLEVISQAGAIEYKLKLRDP